MTDARGRIMRAIKREGTGPELEARALLEKAGVAFSTNRKDLPGSPDVVMDGPRVAAFVNGCFWHSCPACRPARPGSNQGYWGPKLDRNVERDKEAAAALAAAGWKVVTIWECRVMEGIEELLAAVAAGRVDA